MKRINLIYAIFALSIISCIPSLHPIYDENHRSFDDRIIGHWANEDSGLKIYDIDINAQGDTTKLLITKNSAEKTDGIFNISNSGSWRFSRAVNQTYLKEETDGTISSVVLDEQYKGQIDSSLLCNGFQLDKEEKLPYYFLVYKDLNNDSGANEFLMVNLTEINGDMYMDFSPMPSQEEPSRFVVNWVPAHTFAKLRFEENHLVIESFNSEYIEKLIKSKRVRLKHEIVDETIVLTASTEELRAFIAKYSHDENLFLEDEILYPVFDDQL